MAGAKMPRSLRGNATVRAANEAADYSGRKVSAVAGLIAVASFTGAEAQQVTLLVGPLLFVLLGVGAVSAKKAGRSGREVALMVAVGSLFILVVMLGILVWGFRDFG